MIAYDTWTLRDGIGPANALCILASNKSCNHYTVRYGVTCSHNWTIDERDMGNERGN